MQIVQARVIFSRFCAEYL